MLFQLYRLYVGSDEAALRVRFIAVLAARRPRNINITHSL